MRSCSTRIGRGPTTARAQVVCGLCLLLGHLHVRGIMIAPLVSIASIQTGSTGSTQRGGNASSQKDSNAPVQRGSDPSIPSRRDNIATPAPCELDIPHDITTRELGW